MYPLSSATKATERVIPEKWAAARCVRVTSPVLDRPSGGEPNEITYVRTSTSATGGGRHPTEGEVHDTARLEQARLPAPHGNGRSGGSGRVGVPRRVPGHGWGRWRRKRPGERAECWPDPYRHRRRGAVRVHRRQRQRDR